MVARQGFGTGIGVADFPGPVPRFQGVPAQRMRQQVSGQIQYDRAAQKIDCPVLVFPNRIVDVGQLLDHLHDAFFATHLE